MGADSIVNPNAGQMAQTDTKVAIYDGPNPDIVSGVYGGIALLHSLVSIAFYFKPTSTTPYLEQQTFYWAFVIWQASWSPVAISWLLFAFWKNATLYFIYYIFVLISAAGPLVGYSVIEYFYMRSYLAGYTFGVKANSNYTLGLTFTSLVLF